MTLLNNLEIGGLFINPSPFVLLPLPRGEGGEFSLKGRSPFSNPSLNVLAIGRDRVYNSNDGLQIRCHRRSGA